MLFITHDLGVVSELADIVGVMYAGELVECAPAKDFFTRALHPYSKALISCLPKLTGNPKRLNAISGTVPKPSPDREYCAFMDRCAYKVESCAKNKFYKRIPRIILCVALGMGIFYEHVFT